ncbi:MAG: hypothetical protein WCZ66_11815 [Sphingomonadaceae bacterium]
MTLDRLFFRRRHGSGQSVLKDPESPEQGWRVGYRVGAVALTTGLRAASEERLMSGPRRQKQGDSPDGGILEVCPEFVTRR